MTDNYLIVSVILVISAFAAGYSVCFFQLGQKQKSTAFDRLIEAAGWGMSIVQALKNAGVFPADMENRIYEIECRAISEAQAYLKSRYNLEFDFNLILAAIRARYGAEK